MTDQLKILMGAVVLLRGISYTGATDIKPYFFCNLGQENQTHED